MSTARPIILLTGFGPFPTIPANATGLLVPRLARAAASAFPGARIEAHILPTEWELGPQLACDLYRRLRPAVAVHFGVSSRATGFEIEARGRNACSLAFDAAGLLPPGDRLNPAGPDMLPVTLPARHIVERLRRRGIPAALSRDAGGYLCNALLYRTLEMARADATGLRSGFIHVPAALVGARETSHVPAPGCRLTWTHAIDGGLEIVAAALGRTRLPASRTQRGLAAP